MPGKKKGPAYSGELCNPIEIANPPPDPTANKLLRASGTPDLRQQWSGAVANIVCAERDYQFHLLFKHYGIEKGEWRELALRLAIDNVPGFQIVFNRDASRTGRPRKWTPMLRIRLFYDLQAAKKGKRFGIEKACQLLSEREGLWKCPDHYKGENQGWLEVLRRNYFEGKRLVEGDET